MTELNIYDLPLAERRRILAKLRAEVLRRLGCEAVGRAVRADSGQCVVKAGRRH